MKSCTSYSTNSLKETNLRKWKKNLILCSILARLVQVWVPKFFFWVLPLLDVRHCCKLSSYAISRKTQKNGVKPHFGLDIGPLGPNSSCQIFFPQKSGFISHEISWSAKIMCNIRKN